jgi:hypothetical protein
LRYSSKIKEVSVIYFFHAMLSCNSFLKNINDTDPFIFIRYWKIFRKIILKTGLSIADMLDNFSKADIREQHAVGLVANVASIAALDQLRRLAPDLTLSPVSGDDLARRLGLRHYPVLISATGIEP